MSAFAKNVMRALFNLPHRVLLKLRHRVLFRLKPGRRLDLDITRFPFDKLQWIKLATEPPLVPACIDKYEVRSFVELDKPMLVHHDTTEHSGYVVKRTARQVDTKEETIDNEISRQPSEVAEFQCITHANNSYTNDRSSFTSANLLQY